MGYIAVKFFCILCQYSLKIWSILKRMDGGFEKLTVEKHFFETLNYYMKG